MKALIVLTLISLSISTLLSQKKDNCFFYETAPKGSNINVDSLINLFNKKRGVVFFYQDNPLKDTNEMQVKTIAEDSRFINAKIIGIPCEPNKNDRDNVKLGELFISQVACIVYTSDSTDLYRAASQIKYFSVSKENLPPNFYEVRLLNESLCVASNRILFHDMLLMEFLDPQYSNEEKVSNLQDEVNNLNSEVNRLNEIIQSLVNEVQMIQNASQEKDNEQEPDKKKKK